jgi:hypothetical protein
LASKLVSAARNVDDFIIDRMLQPVANRAEWHLGLTVYTLARVFVVLGAGVGLVWVRMFDTLFSTDFVQDMLCLGIMVGIVFAQIRVHEARAPRRPALAPAVRLTGLLWRTLWLLDLAFFPTQWMVERYGQLLGNFVWTVLLVLPYWLICCHTAPPPIHRAVGAFRPSVIRVR